MPDINDLLKPIPVAFDYATFRYYLELDVLQDTAKFLEWVDINPELGGTTRTTIITGTVLAGTQVIVLDAPSPVPILGGADFIHSGGTFNTVGPAIVGETEIPIVEAAPVADTDVTYTIVEENLPYRNAQPIYDAMTDEVLLRMGYTNPLEVPAASIPEMMLLGRIEAWKLVVRNTVTDIDMEYEGVYLVRSRFHQNAVQQLGLAMEDYNRQYGIIRSTYSSPEIRTYAGAVRSRW